LSRNLLVEYSSYEFSTFGHFLGKTPSFETHKLYGVNLRRGDPMRFHKSIIIASLSFVSAFLLHACSGGGTEERSLPAIGYLSPDNTAIGSANFTVTVYGSGFIPESIVRWNGQNRPTTFLGSDRLQATVYAQDVAGPGNCYVSVSNPYSHEEISNSVAFTVYSVANEWTFLGPPTVSGTDYMNVGDISVDREDSNILYVTVYSYGLIVSRDGGTSWETAVAGTHQGAIGVDPHSVDRIFYGQRENLYVSYDRGMTWSLLHTFGPGAIFVNIAVSRIDPDIIYANLSGTNGFFFRSLNGGSTWETYSFGQTVGLDNFIPWAIAEDPVDGTLYVGVELGNHPQPYYPPFLRSVDGGVTWENLVEGMTSLNQGPIWHVTSVVVHPDNHKVYAISEGPGLYTSMDHGLSWSRTPESALIGELTRDPGREGWLFAGSVYYESLDGGVYITTDDGKNFYPFGLQGRTVSGLSLTGNGSRLYAASYQSGIYYTPLP
jgi:photosystem II stability/assembly factor-like uncharacterized protein